MLIPSQIKEILRLHYVEGRTPRNIARKLNINPEATVDAVIQKARARAIYWPLAPEYEDEHNLEAVFVPPQNKPPVPPAPDWAQIHDRLIQTSQTLEQLWREYDTTHPGMYGLSEFSDHYSAYRQGSPQEPPAAATDLPPENHSTPPAHEEAAIPEPMKADQEKSPGRPEGIRPPETNKNGGYTEFDHLHFLGLAYNPFPVAPDDENFYISEHIDQILSVIIHGVVARKGFIVLTGDVGLGKTTISRKIIGILENKGVETSLVFHTAYQDKELLREINRDFGLETESMLFGDQMRLLNDFLLQQDSLDKNCAIIIDDAQNLNIESIELIRMISNLEKNQRKLVQILLIGQPELMEKLNSPYLRQVKSRVIIHEEARPLNQVELTNYLMFKLNAAGNKGQIEVAPKALKRIHNHCRGNFRRLNTLMDRCLYAAYLHNTTEIGEDIVKQASSDLKDEAENQEKTTWSILAVIAVLILGVAVFFLITFGHKTVVKPPPAPLPGDGRAFTRGNGFSPGRFGSGPTLAGGKTRRPTRPDTGAHAGDRLRPGSGN